jgi:PAS domain S-box-containing protein
MQDEHEHKTQEQLINELVEMRQRVAALEAADTERVRAEQAIPERRIWLPVAVMVVLLCILVWLNEIVDLPHLLLGAPHTPINWREAILEIVLIASVGLFAVLRLIRDITERKRAEEALRGSEQKYRTMIEQSNDMIWILDTEGGLTFFNKRCEEISGHRFEDWRGKTFAPLILEEDLPLVVDVFRRTMNGESQHYEVRVRKEDGDIFTLSVNTAPILEAGKVVGTVSFGRDITERVQVEKSLRESEERFQQVAENAQEWIWEVDAHGLYTYASPVVEKMLGYKPEEVVGKKHFYDLA